MEALLINGSCSRRQEVSFTDTLAITTAHEGLTVMKAGIGKDARLGQARRA